MNFNKAILAGNLAADPELRHTSSGKAVANFTLAATRRFRDKDDKPLEETIFVDCAAWGKQGEMIAQHKRKGDNILVEGCLVMDAWEDKATGQKRSKIKIQVTHCEFGAKRQTQD